MPLTRGAGDAASESKRDKRRREMAIKVERIRQETIDRKDSIHADLQESYRIHLNAMLSLPYPTHPEYLLRLHALSVQRDADTLAARLESTYALEQARQLYHSEVDRVEDEYESAKKSIKEKLLEACDERAKKLKEEKDSLELPSLEGGLYGDNGKHQTRRRGVNGFAAGSPATVGGGTSSNGKLIEVVIFFPPCFTVADLNLVTQSTRHLAIRHGTSATSWRRQRQQQSSRRSRSITLRTIHASQSLLHPTQ